MWGELKKSQQLTQVKQYKYLGTTVDHTGQCKTEVAQRMNQAKVAFWKKATIPRSNISMKTRIRIVMCFVFSVVYTTQSMLLKCGATEEWWELVGLLIPQTFKYYRKLVKRKQLCLTTLKTESCLMRATQWELHEDIMILCWQQLKEDGKADQYEHGSMFTTDIWQFRHASNCWNRKVVGAYSYWLVLLTNWYDIFLKFSWQFFWQIFFLFDYAAHISHSLIILQRYCQLLYLANKWYIYITTVMFTCRIIFPYDIWFLE